MLMILLLIKFLLQWWIKDSLDELDKLGTIRRVSFAINENCIDYFGCVEDLKKSTGQQD